MSLNIKDSFIELLEDEICTAATDQAICEFCGRQHGQLNNDIESVAHGDFDGKQYVWGCRCSNFMKYVNFIFQEADVISETLRKFGKFLTSIGSKLKERESDESK